MAPIKFEENIKDKLEQRELKPSPNTWNKLSERLDVEPNKKSNKTYWWLGIAASFVGLLIVSSILFSKGSGERINTPILVDVDIENTVESNEDITKVEKIEQNKIASEEIEKEDVESEKPIRKTNKLIVKKKTEDIALTHKNSIEAATIDDVVSQKARVVNHIEFPKTAEDKKVDEVVAQIQKLKNDKSSVTDADIDALLNQAQEELMAQRLYSESTKTVDAELLLLQVETDLDQSFRDRVFETLKSGYKNVKTAVAGRNN